MRGPQERVPREEAPPKGALLEEAPPRRAPQEEALPKVAPPQRPPLKGAPLSRLPPPGPPLSRRPRKEAPPETLPPLREFSLVSRAGEALMKTPKEDAYDLVLSLAIDGAETHGESSSRHLISRFWRRRLSRSYMPLL